EMGVWLAVGGVHIRAVLSRDAVTTRRPSGLSAALCTQLVWPFNTAIAFPVSTSHSRAVLSCDAVTTRRPSGLNAALCTPFVWPFKPTGSFPGSTSQPRD